MTLRDKICEMEADIIINYPNIGIREKNGNITIIPQTRPMEVTFESHDNIISNIRFNLFMEDELGEFSIGYNVSNIGAVEHWTNLIKEDV